MTHRPSPVTPASRIQQLIRLEYIQKDWATLLQKPLKTFVSTVLPHLSTTDFYPEGKRIFRAFNECPHDKVKVVIIGQDPYPGSYKINGVEFPQATGLAFDNSVLQKNISGSLRNLLKERNEDIGEKTENDISLLQHLPEQGVLLLNTALTVEPGKPNSHAELWKQFTEEVIEELNKLDNIVWVMLGNQAKSYKKQITNETHRFIEAVHPSPLSANRGFFGSKIFSKTNSALKELGHTPILW